MQPILNDCYFVVCTFEDPDCDFWLTSLSSANRIESGRLYPGATRVGGATEGGKDAVPEVDRRAGGSYLGGYAEING